MIEKKHQPGAAGKYETEKKPGAKPQAKTPAAKKPAPASTAKTTAAKPAPSKAPATGMSESTRR